MAKLIFIVKPAFAIDIESALLIVPSKLVFAIVPGVKLQYQLAIFPRALRLPTATVLATKRARCTATKAAAIEFTGESPIVAEPDMLSFGIARGSVVTHYMLAFQVGLPAVIGFVTCYLIWCFVGGFELNNGCRSHL